MPNGTTYEQEFRVTNTGTQALERLTVYNKDTRSFFNLSTVVCRIDELLPGESTSCLTSGTVEDGQYSNRGAVMAWGSNPLELWKWRLEFDHSHYIGRPGVPSVSVESLINGEDADTATGPEVYEGAAVNRTWAVTNTGELALKNLTVTDDQVSPSDNAPVTICTIPALAVGATETCTANSIAGLGQFQYQSVVTGQSEFDQAVEASDPLYYLGKPKFAALPQALPAEGFAPLKVTFKPTVVTDTAIENYRWDFDGNGSWEYSETVGRNYTWTYNTPGTYEARLEVRDSKGQVTVGSVTVTVNNKPPVVSAEASPSNGSIPLTVTFSATASDSDGISQYEWDFDGDGVFDASGAGNSVQHTYTDQGNYRPAVKVTDTKGASTTLQVPTIEVNAVDGSAPTVTASASPSSGNAPLGVAFNAAVTNAGGGVTQWEWDFDGDGTYDHTSASTPSVSHTYTAIGTWYPRVKVTTGDNQSAVDTLEIKVNPSVSLTRSVDTIDPVLGETATVKTVLGGDTRVQIQIEDRDGAAVKVLIPWTDRAAGTWNDSWDATNDDGQIVPEGDYRAILLYEVDGEEKRLDLGLTTGGGQYNPLRTRIPSTFSPFAGDPLEIDFTLSRASEVTAFMGRFNVNTRLVTFYQRTAFGKGTHRIVWNGEGDDGQLVELPAGERFLFGIWGYYLPDNSIYVRSGSHIGGLTSAPSIFSPGSVGSDGNKQLSTLSFNLSNAGSVELKVQDLDSGAELARLTYPGLSAGINTITWDGKDDKGNYVAPGSYRLGVTGVAENGHRSITVYTIQRVYY